MGIYKQQLHETWGSRYYEERDQEIERLMKETNTNQYENDGRKEV